MEFLSRNETSLFGRLNVRLKLAVCFSMSIFAVLLDSLFSLSSLAAIGAVVFLLSRPNRSQVVLVAVISLLLVWGVIFSQALFYNQFPRDALVTILEPNFFFQEGLRIYLQGIHHGAMQSFRMLAVGFVGYAVCFSTEPDDFLSGFIALKIPFSMSFMAVSAIQFIPTAIDEFMQTRTAMRLKGYRPFRRGIGQTVQTEIGGLRSVLGGAIRRSEEKALSILTRGFDILGKRTSLYDDRMKAGECVAASTLLITVLAIGTAKTLFLFYEHQIWSAPSLRVLYEFTREWL
jgi:energy-coupling factor transport system permease protein